MADVCALCGHDPACGFAEAWSDQGRREAHPHRVRLCHADDHSCYHRWTVQGERPNG